MKGNMLSRHVFFTSLLCALTLICASDVLLAQDKAQPVKQERLYRRIFTEVPKTTGVQASPSAAPRMTGLTIIPTFDASITDHARAADITATINAVIAVYQNTFSDQIMVSIKFVNTPTGLGLSNTSGSNVDFTDFRKALVAKSTSPDDTLALSKVPDASTNPVNNHTQVRMVTALGRALGLTGFELAPGAIDSTVSVNLSIMNILTTDNDSAKHSLYTVLVHEVNEALGMGSALDFGKNKGSDVNTRIEPEDLWRYDRDGARSYSYDANVTSFFSLDGTTPLAQFNQDRNGDYGDWFSTGTGFPLLAQNAFGRAGEPTSFLGVELRVLDVIGYTRTNPTAALPLAASSPAMSLAVSSPAACAPASPFASTVATFSVSVVELLGNGALTYAWDFGDGTTDTGPTPTKTYAAAGTYTAKVTATSPNDSVSSSVKVVVQPGLSVSTNSKQRFSLDFAVPQGKDSIYITMKNDDFKSVTDESLIAFSIGDSNLLFDKGELSKFVVTGESGGKFKVLTKTGCVQYVVSGVSLQALLAPYGATNDNVTSNVIVPIFISINGVVYGNSYSFKYTAIQDKHGMGK